MYKSLFAPEDFTPGWWSDIPEEKYHEDKAAVSSTALRAALKSGKMFYHSFFLDAEKEETDPMKLGTATHLKLFKPEEFERRFILSPDFGDQRSPRNRDKKNSWLSEQAPGALILKEEQYKKLLLMVEGVLAYPVARNLLTDSFFEHSGYFKDPVTGLRCRIRPDILRRDGRALPDLKTAREIAPWEFSKEIWSRGYHVQIAFYAYGIQQIENIKPESPCFIVVQNCAPFDVAVYEVDEGAMSRGENAVRKGLDSIARWCELGHFPGVQNNEAELISLPGYTDFIPE